MTKYQKTMQSARWKNLSRDIRSSRSCEICDSSIDLHAHHKHYYNMGAETFNDLSVLCSDCHALWHQHHNHGVLTQDILNQIKHFISLGETKDTAIGLVESSMKMPKECRKAKVPKPITRTKKRKKKPQVTWSWGEYFKSGNGKVYK